MLGGTGFCFIQKRAHFSEPIATLCPSIGLEKVCDVLGGQSGLHKRTAQGVRCKNDPLTNSSGFYADLAQLGLTIRRIFCFLNVYSFTTELNSKNLTFVLTLQVFDSANL